MTVQSVLFPIDTFTKTQAKKWLKDHGYKYSKVDETEYYYRFRQMEPNDTYRYRTYRLPNGVRFVLAYKY